MPSLPQSLLVRLILLRVLKSDEKNEALIVQGKMVSSLLHCLYTHKSMGLIGSTQEC